MASTIYGYIQILIIKWEWLEDNKYIDCTQISGFFKLSKFGYGYELERSWPWRIYLLSWWRYALGF